MILEIEYYKGDITLFGKQLDECSLRKLLNEAEHICGDFGDFSETLCLYYRFENIITDMLPEWIYDRDTKLLYLPKG